MKETLQYAHEYIQGLFEDLNSAERAAMTLPQATFSQIEIQIINDLRAWYNKAGKTLVDSQAKAAQVDLCVNDLTSKIQSTLPNLTKKERVISVVQVRATGLRSFVSNFVDEEHVELKDKYSILHMSLTAALQSIKDKKTENIEIARAKAERDVLNETLHKVRDELSKTQAALDETRAELNESRMNASLANKSFGGKHVRSPSGPTTFSLAADLGASKVVDKDLSDLRKIIIPKRLDFIQKLLKLRNGKADPFVDLIVYKLCLTAQLPLDKGIIEKEISVLQDKLSGDVEAQSILKDIAQYQESPAEHKEQQDKLNDALRIFISKAVLAKGTTPLIQTLKVLRELYRSGNVLPKDEIAAKNLDEKLANVIRGENATRGIDPKREVDTYKRLAVEMLRQLDLQVTQVPVLAP